MYILIYNIPRSNNEVLYYWQVYENQYLSYLLIN